MACRDATRANEACAKIIAETNNKNIEVELIDLSRLKSIREFCARINKKLKRLDVLINNAGLFLEMRQF
jgi:NADP-dependent 3-hydroxy acid dehydrogenase YdfG